MGLVAFKEEKERELSLPLSAMRRRLSESQEGISHQKANHAGTLMLAL